MDLSILNELKTNKDRNILTLSDESPVLVIFLRHFGCIYCRASLKELAAKKSFFEAKNVKLVFVHMADDKIADAYFGDHGLPDAEHISDPSTRVYQSFGLGKGNLNQLFGLKNWIRGFEAVSSGTFIELKQVGDGFQMPGVFLIFKKSLEESYVHYYASDRPDYENMLKCCVA